MGLTVPVIALLGALVVVAAGSLVQRGGRELAKIPVEDEPQEED
ncbi:MAG: hypothetical protein ABSG98_01770 [Anaerolineales bacterium]|jgi:hypothetical protein